MKALVLSGGMGTRLRPFSNTIAKQLVPVANKPVLFYGLEAIAEVGVTKVGIVVGKHEAEIREAVGDGSRFGFNVQYIPQERPSGLAHCVLIAREFLGDDDFIMYLGDNIVADGLGELVGEYASSRPDAMVLLGKASDPAEYGTAVVGPDGLVVRLEEKSRTFVSDLAVTGAYVFSPIIHQAVRSIRPSWRNELEITHAMQWLVDHGYTVGARICHGYWRDTGKLDDWLACNRVLVSRLAPDVRGEVDGSSRTVGPVVLEETATVVGSQLVGPLIIGAGSTIRNSRIGPYTAIGEDCVVKDSDIEDSLILCGATLDGVRELRTSLIGRDALIRQNDGTPRLIVGDNSQIQLRA